MNPKKMSGAQIPIQIDWNTSRRDDWERLAATSPFCPFEQSWLYGAAYAQGSVESVRRAVIHCAGEPVAIAQVFQRRFGGAATLAQILRGPVLLDPALRPDAVTQIYCRLNAECRSGPRQLLFWTPELPAGEAAIAAMRECGMRQLLTGYGSVRVDLTQEERALRAALHGKWRNALVRAEATALRTDPAADEMAGPWLLAHYAALRRRRRFGGPSPDMLAYILLQTAARDSVLLRAFSANDPVAGALFLRHGQSASYLVGWADETGRAANAGALLLWRGMIELRRRGVRTLDLGGVDTRHARGIARFKLGVGGSPYRLAGTFA